MLETESTSRTATHRAGGAAASSPTTKSAGSRPSLSKRATTPCRIRCLKRARYLRSSQDLPTSRPAVRIVRTARVRASDRTPSDPTCAANVGMLRRSTRARPFGLSGEVPCTYMHHTTYDAPNASPISTQGKLRKRLEESNKTRQREVSFLISE